MRTAPLADYIEPWIVADAALRRRDRLRNIQNDDERSAGIRMMPWIGYLVFFGLVWLFGLAVIGWFWWRSMPAHEPLLTGWLALVFAFTLWVYFKSRHRARDHLRNTRTPEKWRKWFPVVFAAIAGLTVWTRRLAKCRQAQGATQSMLPASNSFTRLTKCSDNFPSKSCSH